MFVDVFFLACFCKLVLINWTIPACPSFMRYLLYTRVKYRKDYVWIFLCIFCFLLYMLNAYLCLLLDLCKVLNSEKP